MYMYIFFFSKYKFQLVNLSFISPIWTLYPVSWFSQLAYNKNHLSAFLHLKYTAWKTFYFEDSIIFFKICLVIFKIFISHQGNNLS